LFDEEHALKSLTAIEKTLHSIISKELENKVIFKPQNQYKK
jgi:hypothetical protein